MVKVGSMRRAKRILLIASALVLCAGGASPSWFRHKGDKPAKQPAVAATAAPLAAMTLNAIEIESAPSVRLVLRTSGTPAYTSYSPMPARFVVDLTDTAKSASFTLPSPLPPSIAAVDVDEVTEMGSRLVRVTLNLAQPMAAQAAAVDNGVSVTLPAALADKPADPALPAVVPVVPPAMQSAAAPEPEAVKVSEPVVIAEPIKSEPIKSEPAKTQPIIATPQRAAKSLKKIETTGSGSMTEVSLTGDGEITYKAFKLENPARVVVDLNVHNKMAKNAIATNDSLLKKIRVSQFTPDVTRVVLDLGASSDYHVVSDGDRLRVTFGSNVAAASVPAPQVAEVAAPAPAPVRVIETPKPAPVTTVAKADIPAQVPTVAEEASWKMPAKAIISSPAPQTTTPPKKSRTGRTTAATSTPADAAGNTPVTGENVFGDATGAQPVLGSSQPPQPTRLSGQLSGSRTLSSNEKVYTGEPISLNLKDADIKDVLRTFQQLTGLNIAVDPGVGGSVTVDFNDVPWDQALDIILRQNNLTFVLEGNVMRVGTVQHLAEEARAQAALVEQERLSVPTQTVSYILSYARAAEVAALLRDISSPRAKIIVDPRTNQLIISEIPAVLQTMQHLIESVDVATRQVVIEARIVETSKTFLQQYGFTWGFAGKLDPSLGTGTGLVFPNRVDFVGGPFEFGPGNPVISTHLSNVLGTFTLDLALLAAESEGLVKVISAPRVMTQDNSSAEIQSGFQIPVQMRVNFTTTIQYVDATLRLSVTPQITQAGTVIMDIALQKTEPTTGLAVEGAAGTPLSTRQAKTRLMVRDGGTSVIAGIYQTKDNDARTRLPFVHQIPIIGNLFKAHNVNSSHDELLIFITPRIVRSS